MWEGGVRGAGVYTVEVLCRKEPTPSSRQNLGSRGRVNMMSREQAMLTRRTAGRQASVWWGAAVVAVGALS